jgi:DNA-directed RNA polymerase subunit N
LIILYFIYLIFYIFDILYIYSINKDIKLIYKFVYNKYIKTNPRREENKMIIPIKCFTCGKVIGDKYRYYLIQVKKMKIEKEMKNDKVIYLTQEFTDKTPEGYVLDDLGFNKICCRRHFLTHVDIE